MILCAFTELATLITSVLRVEVSYAYGLICVVCILDCAMPRHSQRYSFRI